jgi:hypothetical protein
MNWIESLEAWFWWLAATSLLIFIASPVMVGWFAVRLPKDYFTAPRRKPLAVLECHSLLRPVIVVAKNLFGAMLVAAGLLMLVVPGQGMLTIVVGLLLLDFPGKFRLERWLVSRPTVWRSINWLRRRAGREPFSEPMSAESD